MIISQVLFNSKIVNEKLIYVLGCINNKKLLILLNTITSNNFMSSEVAKRIGLEITYCPKSTTILLFGQSA